MEKSFLSIETSLNRIFLVLYIKENLISNNKILENSIEVEINQMFDEILEQAQARFSDLDYIMVSLGPGSYTGTRVGLAAAKAIAVSINKPIFGYTNFSAIYNQGIIDNLIKSNSNTGIIIKASKYDAYYQQIKNNFFSDYRVLSINDLNKNYQDKIINPLPSLPFIVPPSGFGIEAFPAIVEPLVTPPIYPEPPPPASTLPPPPP